ncbi:hypothetical protein STEG23_004762 [Scotinomys teguina]
MAPKTLSPDQIMEEPVTVVSCEEVSSDVSVTEKYSKEEALAGSSPNLSMLHYDDTSESMAERNLPLPKSTSGSRRRQQVQECPSASSTPDRLPEDLSSHTNPGHVSQEDVSMLSSSGDLGEASLVSSPEKQPADTTSSRGCREPEELFECKFGKLSVCHFGFCRKLPKLTDLPAVVRKYYQDNIGFNRLLEYLKPQYSLPSPSYCSRTAVPSMCDNVKQIITSHVKEAESGVVHFTSGIWMSSQTREYLTLTAHWVTFASAVRPHCEDHHCSALLDVSQVDCDYSGNSIQKQLECWWEAWVTSIGLQIGITVTDNPSIGKMLSEGEHSSVQCFSHTVNLIVSEAIKSQRMVQNVLSIARKLCERVHRSPRAREKLAELQKDYELPQYQLIQDVPSKWSMSFHMLERLIEQKRAVNEVSIECNFRELISCDHWELMQSVCHVLRPFDAAS